MADERFLIRECLCLRRTGSHVRDNYVNKYPPINKTETEMEKAMSDCIPI